jgi:hypothetical protein
MTMFNFQDPSRPSVSPRFWIYWAVTLPVTLVTLGAWWMWVNRTWLK